MYSSSVSIFLTCLFAFNAHAIMFHLQPNSQKCLKDEVQAHQLIVIEFVVSDAPGQRIDYVVRDSKGGILSQKENLVGQGKSTFTSEIYDSYEVCIVSRVPQELRKVVQEISLVTKKGVEARNYDGIGEAGKLKPLEVDLKRLEDLSDAIVQDFAATRKREEEMRNTNESTNSRVLFFSIFSMCCLLGLATWQVLYLRRYFKAKKLIE